MANAKGLKSKDYIKAKSGKIYQLQGRNKYMKITNGKSISAKKTYKVTQQRHIYKQGKTYKYYYVTSGKTSGWTWNKYLKAGTYHAPVKKDTSASQSSQAESSPNQTTSSPNQTTSSSSQASKPTDNTYSESAVVSDLLGLFNQARAGLGTGALSTDGALQQVANERAVQLTTDFNHADASGKGYAEPIAKKLGIWDSYYGSEDIAITGIEDTNMETAKQLFTLYKSSAPHWNDVMNSDFTKVGIKLYNSNYTLYNAIELGY